MRHLLISICLLLVSTTLCAQDAYHTALQMQLADEYNLPAATFSIDNTEAAINNSSYTWIANKSVQNSEGTDFSQKLVLTSAGAGANPWDAGWGIKNKERIVAGDRVLVVYQIRSAGGTGRVNSMVENATTYDQEVFLSISLTEEWQLFYIPFQASRSFNADALQFGLHLATQAQTVELGGFTVLNYGQSIPFDQLPNRINNDKYEGYETDAPWRSTAAERITQLRKAPLSIEVIDSNGNPVSDAVINVEMQEHQFGFGTAITAERIAGNPNQNNIYQARLLDLDGRGHGFNWVVFENDLKWPAWEDNWFVSNDQLANAVQWVSDQGLQLRGHTLVWPGLSNLPGDISQNTSNTDYIKNRIDNHIEEIMTYPGIAGNVAEWDVLNETVTNKSLQNIFSREAGYQTGRELYKEIFDKAKATDPNTGLWLNDYVTITLANTGGGQYDSLKLFTQELLDAGAPIDGLGFQAHIGGFPNGIPSVLATLDDFYDSFGLRSKITEYDIAGTVSEELAATYLRDFMTAIFSHPSMDGFLMWSFWDGAAWREGNNLFRRDWSRTPAADTFTDLIFNEWWTDESLTTDAAGAAQATVFKGRYEISYECDGELVTLERNIDAPTEITIPCDNTTTSTKEWEATAFQVYPNPSEGVLTLERATATPASLRLLDMQGRVLREEQIYGAFHRLSLEQTKGMYILEVSDAAGVSKQKVMLY